MNIEQQKELSDLCNAQIKLAQEYKEAREATASAKTDIDILLVASLPTIRAKKPNVGVDMAIKMLMETNTVAQKLHTQYELQRAKYKGLEVLINAHQNKISALQSLMRYVRKGEQYGV